VRVKRAENLSPAIVVVIAGPPKAQAEVATQLMGRLLRRGLKVRALRTPQERVFSDGDIVLVPCGPKEVEKLARRIEQEWMESWLTWYAIQKRPPQGRR